MPSAQEVLATAGNHLQTLGGHVFDLLTISKPVSPDAAVNLLKVISKLSPLLGNLIEFNTVEFLNDQKEFSGIGKWVRQDPGFPDATFVSKEITPTPGFEIKAWFPLATDNSEIQGQPKSLPGRPNPRLHVGVGSRPTDLREATNS